MSLNAGTSGYVRAGLLDMYYDVQGAGPPLLLLHGGMGTGGMFDELRRRLNDRSTTIAIEQQGHGHTADADRPLRFAQMADDTAEAIRELGLTGCSAFGYSDGGNVALGLAIRHPDLLRRVAICGTNAHNDGLTPETRAHLVDGAKQPPAAVAAGLPDVMREAYESVAPDPANWPLLVHRVFELAATFEGWDQAQLREITAPLLIMIGDRDIVTREHALWLSRQCARSQLCILPDTDHMAPISRAHWISAILSDFLHGTGSVLTSKAGD